MHAHSSCFYAVIYCLQYRVPGTLQLAQSHIECMVGALLRHCGSTTPTTYAVQPFASWLRYAAVAVVGLYSRYGALSSTASSSESSPGAESCNSLSLCRELSWSQLSAVSASLLLLASTALLLCSSVLLQTAALQPHVLPLPCVADVHNTVLIGFKIQHTCNLVDCTACTATITEMVEQHRMNRSEQDSFQPGNCGRLAYEIFYLISKLPF